MKAIIQIAIFVLFMVVLVNAVIIFKDLGFGFLTNALYRMPLVVFLSIGIFYLYRLYRILTEREEAELVRKVERETQIATIRSDDYVLKPAVVHFLFILVIFALIAIAPIYFGIKQLYESHETSMTILFLVLVLLGVIFGFGVLHYFFLLAGKPVIRINQRGISHFMMDFIDWKDVAGIYLHTLETQGGKQHSLEVSVKNPSAYKGKNKSLVGRFLKNEPISLYLPVSEENARITEAVAEAFAVRANAPLLYFEIEISE
jgi:hypothetical protein